mmetsp:Transcript_27705/g.88054  ORF Transcript_27705/g.88054 Transcript_27705/m.88054 type:complete len:351 (-) Transcript_27705:58-1110(-)
MLLFCGCGGRAWRPSSRERCDAGAISLGSVARTAARLAAPLPLARGPRLPPLALARRVRAARARSRLAPAAGCFAAVHWRRRRAGRRGSAARAAPLRLLPRARHALRPTPALGAVVARVDGHARQCAAADSQAAVGSPRGGGDPGRGDGRPIAAPRHRRRRHLPRPRRPSAQRSAASSSAADSIAAPAGRRRGRHDHGARFRRRRRRRRRECGRHRAGRGRGWRWDPLRAGRPGGAHCSGGGAAARRGRRRQRLLGQGSLLTRCTRDAWLRRPRQSGAARATATRRRLCPRGRRALGRSLCPHASGASVRSLAWSRGATWWRRPAARRRRSAWASRARAYPTRYWSSSDV